MEGIDRQGEDKAMNDTTSSRDLEIIARNLRRAEQFVRDLSFGEHVPREVKDLYTAKRAELVEHVQRIERAIEARRDDEARGVR